MPDYHYHIVMPMLGLLCCWEPPRNIDWSIQPSNSAMFPYSILSYLPISHQMFSTLPKCTTITSIPYSQYVVYTLISQRKLKLLDGKKFVSTWHQSLQPYTHLSLSPFCFNGKGVSLPICYELNCNPQNSHVETLTPNVTVLGNRAS